jgi:outer membrane protein assembly factor BamB
MKYFLKSIIIISLIAVIISSCDKNGDPVIPEPDPGNEDHTELWSYDMGIGGLDDITPAIDENDNIYLSIVNMDAMNIVAIGLGKDGNELWKRDFPGSSTGKTMYLNGKLFVSTGYPTAVYCLNASTGDVDWSSNLSESYDFSDNPYMAIANNKLYLTSHELFNGYLMSFDITGAEIWVKQAPPGFNMSIIGNSLFFHDMDYLYRYDDNGITCDSVWAWEFPNTSGNRSFNTLYDIPVGADGNIYLRDEAAIYIVSQSGQTIKTINLTPDFYESISSNITLTSDNSIIIGNGNLVKIGNGGDIVWETNIEGFIVSPYFAASATISQNGDMYDGQLFGLFSVKSNGSLNWKVTSENGGGEEHVNLHPPVLNHNGDIISVATEASTIRCFKGDGHGLATSGWPKPFGDYANTSSK